MIRLRRLSPLLFLTVVLLGCSSNGTETVDTIRVVASNAATTTDNNEGETTLPSATAESLREATVRIETTGVFSTPEIGAEEVFAGSGSGFVIDQSGLIVTNNHVVAGAAIVKVFFDGRADPVPGRVVATSECSDLAVVDVDGDGYKTASWVESPAVTGTTVRAAGFADGQPQFTLTEGIVSRESVAGSTPWASIPSLMQHDAELRPGNSGGPLVNAAGAVVGVNVAASSKDRFAVPAAVARPVVERLEKGDDVDSIGLNAQAVLDKTTNESGVWVVSVQPGSPADKIGLTPGDVITRVKGLRVALDGTMADFCGVVRSAGNDEIPIEVKRGSEFFAGNVHGDGLQPVLGVIADTKQAATNTAADVIPPAAGTPYTEYSRVQDDTGTVAFDIPTAWTDRLTAEVTDAGAPRPTIAASTNMAESSVAARSTYDVPGVEATVYRVGSSMEETFDVVVTQNAPWSYDCIDGKTSSFEDGSYRGVLGVFAGCNGSHLFISMAIERIGTGRWMMLNVLAPTLAEVDAAARILETFDFLGGGAATPSDTPADQKSPPTTVLPEQLPSTLSNVDAIVNEVGAPTTEATIAERNELDSSIAVTYEHAGDTTVVADWLAALPDRVGCTNLTTSVNPPADNEEPAWLAMSCDLKRDGSNFAVAVTNLVGHAGSQTTVQVTRW
jgi:serine protease Do